MTLQTLLRSDPWLINGPVRGGLTTRRGFPAAAQGSDDEPARAMSREILGRALGTAPGRMAWLRQVHGTTVHTVEHERGLRGEGDALVSGQSDAVLLVSVADCGPVLLWDAHGPAFGVVHAGWRGLVAGVVDATVRALTGLGARSADLRAWVGPCIGPEHFEVGWEVAELFDPADIRGQSERGRPLVDLPGAIRRRLLDSGLAPQFVRMCGDCTYARADLYWSYRRDGGICGRQLGYLARR